MPEIRIDPVSGRAVIVAPERANRPDEYGSTASVPCVFCPGREKETPKAILRLPLASGWRARVVPNKYPAIDRASGGAHEVVIESSRHATTFGALSIPEISDVLGLWRSRLIALKAEQRFAYATVFKNEGGPAGASLEHVHSQVLALPDVPPDAAARFARFARTCPICNDRGAELVVAELGGFSARVPRAPRFPYEVRFAPVAHEARFEDLADARPLATLLADVLGRLARCLGTLAYNLVVQTAPFREAGHFHWHFELLPRTSRPGGCEWGSGVFINTALPEDSARRLREARA
jgi:UDPglucose--hexose-1-phosphate uridylyltransferase